MKYVIYLLILIAVALIIYNATMLDFNDLLTGNSKTALISILGAGCVILLLAILLISKAIQKKTRGR